MENIKIKDFIIDIGTNKNENTKKIKKSSVGYKLKVENDMDFVLNRKTSKSDKDLVIIVSQELFYIKDNKTEEVIELNKENHTKKLSAFLRDMEDEIKFTELAWCSSIWFGSRFDEVFDGKKLQAIKLGINKKVPEHHLGLHIEHAKKNKKLYKYFCNNIGVGCVEDKLVAVYKILETTNYNNAITFIDLLKDSKISIGSHLTANILVELIKNYNMDINTFLQYITHGIKRQGYSCIIDCIYKYRDYLKMQKDMYGKAKVKYPKYLKSQHDIEVVKYNLWTKYNQDMLIFDNYKLISNLEYSDKEYSIIIPKCSADVLDEAIQQSNCVASYVERISKGDTHILFMRYKNTPDDSLVTIEVDKSNNVCQCKQGFNKETTKEQDKFISKWAKEKGLNITYIGSEK